jgi:hypothetical protein
MYWSGITVRVWTPHKLESVNIIFQSEKWMNLKINSYTIFLYMHMNVNE